MNFINFEKKKLINLKYKFFSKRTSSIGENIKFFVGKFEVLDENAKVSSKTLIRCKNGKTK